MKDLAKLYSQVEDKYVLPLRGFIVFGKNGNER